MVEPIAEAALAFTLFDKTLKVLGLIREGKKARSEKIDQALFALYAAVNETKSYQSSLENKEPRDRQREFAIAQMWQKASIPLREIDPELADRCFLKGGYWMDPDAWSARRIKAKRISIDQMFEATRSLLVQG